MKTFKKKTKKANFHRDFVQVINGVLQLSHRESEVFALMLRLDHEHAILVEETGNILSTDMRALIMKETRVTKTNLMKYIYTYRDKSLIIPNGPKKWLINPIFKTSYDEPTKEVTFVLEVEDA